MEKIASFTINHLDLLPGIYVSRKDKAGEAVLTTFDLRMTKPNREPVLNTAELHTIEHLGATYLRNHPEDKITQKILEDKMHLSNPTVTVIVQSMIGKGLIAKEKDTEDRRKYILHMTEKGKAALNNGRGESRAADERAYEGLSREDIDYLKSIMRRIMDNLIAEEKK